MLFVWLGFLTVRIGAWRERVTSLIGFLTPYFYYVIFLFLSDGLNEVIEGYLARVVQHEYDHLEGKVFLKFKIVRYIFPKTRI